MMWTPEQARAPLEGALRVPDAMSTLGRAVWLYVLLLTKAGDRGHVIQNTTRLAKDLSVPEDAIVRWLDHLRDARLITISSPPPYLVGRIVFWPDIAVQDASNASVGSSQSPLERNNVPVSSSTAAASASGEDRGLGEGEPLLAEVLGAIPEADPDELRGLLVHHAPEVVRRALVRVRTTPTHEIRKSKEALFRYLLTRLTRGVS